VYQEVKLLVKYADLSAGLKAAPDIPNAHVSKVRISCGHPSAVMAILGTVSNNYFICLVYCRLLFEKGSVENGLF
jgi:hypothetical protein